jgi:group I intron endonuclease
MDNSGVYKITNPKGKVYIGKSCHIKRRFIEHKNCSKTGKTKLYNSIRKYGIENHKIEAIFLSDIQYEIDKMESIYIRYYDCINTGLNHIDEINGISGFLGKKHTKENVLKIKERMNGFKPTKAIEKRMKKVFCGYTNKYYDSISDCAKDLNVSHSLLSLQLNGKRINKYNII